MQKYQKEIGRTKTGPIRVLSITDHKVGYFSDTFWDTRYFRLVRFLLHSSDYGFWSRSGVYNIYEVSKLNKSRAQFTIRTIIHNC